MVAGLLAGTAHAQQAASSAPVEESPLVSLTCADFIAAADAAVNAPNSDLGKAAQDDIANGLTWVHGYMYAKRDGAMPRLTQDWLRETAKRLNTQCRQEGNGTANLFELATDQ